MNHLKKIIKRVNRNGDFYNDDTPTPLLTIKEFFEGNDVIGSIGCNLEAQPHPSEIESVLIEIQLRSDVHCAYVQITEMDDPDWPFSDTVWIVTTATESDILGCFPAKLAPDEIWEGFFEDRSYEEITVPDDFQVLACWWD